MLAIGFSFKLVIWFGETTGAVSLVPPTTIIPLAVDSELTFELSFPEMIILSTKRS